MPDRNRRLLDAIPGGVCVLDADDRVVYVNQDYCATFGFRRETLLGRRVVGIPTFDGCNVTDDPAPRGGGARCFQLDFERDGRRTWVQITATPLFDAGGRYDGLIGILTDITPLKTMEAALRQHAGLLEALIAERTARVQLLERRRVDSDKLAALGQLAAGVAHEINNPLAGIKNAMLLVKEAIPPTDAHWEYVGMVEREVDRIGDIVRKLFEVYRPPAAARQAIDLRGLLRDVAALADHALRAGAVRLVVDAAAELPRVVVPPGQVMQVIEHLVRNAIEASPPGAEVRVAVGAAADVLRVVVSDDGRGIAADVLPHIWDPFFTTKAGDGGQHGLGLGLSVTQSIVHALGGRLQVTSRPDAGTTVTVTLPVEWADDEPDAPQITSASRSRAMSSHE